MAQDLPWGVHPPGPRKLPPCGKTQGTTRQGRRRKPGPGLQETEAKPAAALCSESQAGILR